jgi:hypothetical protein
MLTRLGSRVAFFAMVVAAAVVFPALRCGGEEDANPAAPRAVSPAVHAQAESLVAKLGDERFATRESATEQLMKIGILATQALEEGMQNPDREIRYRSARILETIRKVDFESRLAAFAEDVRGTKSYDLPGWERFHSLVGGDANARAVFVEMQRDEWALLHAADKGAKEGSDALAARCEQIQVGTQFFRQQVTLGNVAALLFVASDENITIPDQVGGQLYNFCYQTAFGKAIVAGATKDPLRRLLGAWVARGGGPWTAYQSLMLALRHDLKEGLVPAEKVLRDNAQPVHVRQYAILAIAKLGNESHLEVLEIPLKDTTICLNTRTNNMNKQTQIRDVALAACVSVTGQDPKSYNSEWETNPQLAFNPGKLGFEDDASRQKAFDKWEAYKSGRKKANDAK